MWERSNGDIEASFSVPVDQISTVTELCVFLTFAERLVVKLWELSCFGNASRLLNEVQIGTIRKCVDDTLKLSRNFSFDQGVWLAGRKAGSGDCSEKDKAAVVLATGCALLKDSPCFVPACDLLCSLFEDSSALVASLVRHDERCLNVGMALFHIHDLIGEIDILNPINVIICVFAHMCFDHETILEWLDSELVAVTLLNRSLESLSESNDNLEDWRRRAEVLQKTFELAPDGEGSWLELAPEPADDDIIFTVKEMAGERLLTKEIRLSRQPTSRVYVPAPRLATEEPLFDRLYDMLVRLRLRLEATEERQLAGFSTKRLCRLIEKFEAMVDKEFEGSGGEGEADDDVDST